MQTGTTQRKYYLMLLAFVGMISCTRKADVNLPPHIPTLVLHSYLDVGEKFKAALGRTVSTDTWVVDSAMNVKDGWMVLYENGSFKDSLHYDSVENRYVASTAVAEIGKSYRLVAGAQGYATVEATTSAPHAVNTLSLQHIRNSRTDAAGSSLDDVVFSFQDPGNEKNYYMAELRPAFPGMNYVCVYTYDPSVEKYTEGLLPFDQNSCISSQEIMYTDKAFNGKLKEITLSTDSYSLQTYTDPFTGEVMRPYLKRLSISEEYYKYFRETYAIYVNSGGPTLSDPIIIKGNVKNGYGLFTIFTSVTDSLP